MDVHIIKDTDLSQELYQEVVELLQEFNGPLRFFANEEFAELKDLIKTKNTLGEDEFTKKEEIPDVIHRSSYSSSAHCSISFPYEREEFSPEDLLQKCVTFRKRNDIGDDEIVILLTEKANDLNWFSYGDENKNVFIHTSEWDFYLDCNRSFPIAHQVASNVLQLILFKDMSDLKNHLHIDESRGCINDFCMDKKDIRLKMKTADICTDCQDLLIERSFPNDVFIQITNILEALRKKVISVERFTSRLTAGRIIFKGYLRKMILADAGDYEVKLTPLEKTVYHLFMENPEGIRANDIADHREEIVALYNIFFNGSNIAQFNNSVDALCNYLDGSMQEKISNINKKLTKTLGYTLCLPYIIRKHPSDEKYKITIDRGLVSYED